MNLDEPIGVLMRSNGKVTSTLMRTILPAICAFLVIGILIGISSVGCGGGGSTGTNGTNGGGALSLYPSTANVGAGGTVQLQAQANFLNVDVSWSSDAGLVSPTGIGTATFTAPASGVSTITATRIGVTGSDTSAISVDPTTATVRGRVVDGNTFGGIGNAIVEFKNGNTIVATATTIPNGSFSAAVPTTATRFHIRSSSISSGFYKQYLYSSKRYTMLDATCTAPLPALSVGANVLLLTNIVISPASGPPPPPPNGCP